MKRKKQRRLTARRIAKLTAELDVLDMASEYESEFPSCVYSATKYPRRRPDTELAIHYNRKTGRMWCWYENPDFGRKRWVRVI
jgi:hypothetical protein